MKKPKSKQAAATPVEAAIASIGAPVPPPPPLPAPTETPPCWPVVERLRLPDERRSITHAFVIRTQDGPRKFYVTVGMYPNGRMGEMFISEGKEGSTGHGYLDTLATAVSIGLQYGVPLSAFIEKMRGMQFEPAGPLQRCAEIRLSDQNLLRYAKSPIDYIAQFLSLRFPDGIYKDPSKKKE